MNYLEQVTILPADFDSGEEPLFRGHVDLFDRENGLEGWAINPTSPQQPLELELVIGSTVVARRSTTEYRADISGLLNERVCPGFCFEASLFKNLRNYFQVHGDSRIKIRLAGTNFVLPSAAEGPTLGSVLDQIDGHDHAPDKGFSLAARLSNLLSDASSLISMPLRPIDDYLAGYIEAIAVDDSNMVWFVGWMNDNPVVDHAAVLVDRQKIMAGMTFSYYPRDDLKLGAYGIVGALLSDWRPSSNSEPIIYFGPSCKVHLRCLAPLRVVSIAEFQHHVRELSKHSRHRLSRHLLDLIDSTASWTVAESHNRPIKAAIDKVLILPGFGLFIRGWVMSPLLKVRSFVVRIGALTLDCDSRSLYFHERPDLLQAFPGDLTSVSRAGFCCVCRGDVRIDDLRDPMLKIVFEDGSSENQAIDVGVIHRLGHAASLETVLEFYPSLEAERFFPDLASAYYREVSHSSMDVIPRQVKVCSSAVVMIVPEERHDSFLMFEQLRRGAASFLAGDCGLILIAAADKSHGELLSQFTALDQSLNNPCSLFLQERPEWGLYALPEILMLAHVERFCFLAAGHFPTTEGWRNIEREVDKSDDSLTFLEVVDPAQEDLPSRLSSAAFIWSASPFASWLVRAPLVIGEHIEAHHFPPSESHLPQKAVRFARGPVTSRLISAINHQSLIASKNDIVRA